MPYSGRIAELTKEAVIALNLKWDSEGWTNAAIKEEMDKHNESASISTIQRIRNDKNGDGTYNYNSTIKSYMRVFSNISSEPIKISETTSAEELQTAALNNTILMKEADIAALEADLKVMGTKCAELTRQMEEAKAAERRKIEHLIEELDDLKEFMGDRKGFILRMEEEKKSLRRENNIKSVLIVILFMMMILGFGTDAIIPIFS